MQIVMNLFLIPFFFCLHIGIEILAFWYFHMKRNANKHLRHGSKKNARQFHWVREIVDECVWSEFILVKLSGNNDSQPEAHVPPITLPNVASVKRRWLKRHRTFVDVHKLFVYCNKLKLFAVHTHPLKKKSKMRQTMKKRAQYPTHLIGRTKVVSIHFVWNPLGGFSILR